MESSNIVTLVIVLIGVIGFVAATRSLKKGGRKKAEEFHQHLRTIGVRASLEEIYSDNNISEKRSRTRKSVGQVTVRDRNIDYIHIDGTATQYGVQYYLDFMVRRPALIGMDKVKKTKMKKKRSSVSGTNVMDIEWRGDDILSQKLNHDYALRDKLLQSDLKVLKNSIDIYPEPKQEHSKIRTPYFLPTTDLFEVIDLIARHIKTRY